MLARVSFLGALLAALAGCGATYNIEGSYTCTNPDEDHLGPDGMPDPCHYQDADAGSGCAVGEFVHWQNGWEAPSLLWIGPEDQAPECPLGPMTIGYEGRTDLVAPDACEPCTCEPPTGSCALPSTFKVQAEVCGPQGAPPIYWNAPVPWGGLCDGTTQVPGGKAYSVKIDPLTMTENGCAPGPTIPAKVISLHWNTFARSCDMPWPMGPLQRTICLPDDQIPPGFAMCIFKDGENDCPTEPGSVFTEQHFFYKGVEDDRQCSACTCGPPEGSACTATISIYTNSTCSLPALDQKTISSAGTACLDIQLPGQALRSKSAGSTTYIPGMCPAMGGDASGSAIKTKPATLCCRP